MSSPNGRELLEIVVVGAGLSGIGAAISCALAGHSVRVLEAAKRLDEIGAGLQITPNSSRLLYQWKLPSSVLEASAEPTAVTVHRYSGEVLSYEPSFHEKTREKYGFPLIDMHRADLQKALHSRAIDLGVKFCFNERVQSIDFSQPAVTTGSGNTFTGDLIIAADGLWSRCRECFLGTKADPLPTGDLAYRIVLPVNDIQDDELRNWVEEPEMHFWIGPNSHAVGYSMQAGEAYNLVLLVPDTLPPGVARQPGSLEELRQLFMDWDPVLNRFLTYVNKVDKWKLMHREEMSNWINKESNLVFIGDACHAMLPYLAQGANSSLEDAAVLGTLLGKITNKKQLPHVLRTYESLRKRRGEAISRETFKQRHDFHLPDGPEQEARDAIFRSRARTESSESFPSRWTCPQVQPWLYGYDAVKEAEEAAFSDPLFH